MMFDMNETLKQKLDANVRDYLARLNRQRADEMATQQFFETLRHKPKLWQSIWEQKFLLGWLFLVEPFNHCPLRIHETVKGKKQKYQADFVTSAREWFQSLGLHYSMEAQLKLDKELIVKCVIEIDGYTTHYFTKQQDLARDADLQLANYQTFRFPSSKLHNDEDITSCLNDVKRTIQSNIGDILETCEFDIRQKGR